MKRKTCFQTCCVKVFIVLLLLPTTANYTDQGRDIEEQGALIANMVVPEKLKPTRWQNGSTTITNEARLDLFKPYLQKTNDGGIYIGVGSTQNFTLAAWARAGLVYLVDFTRVVVFSNRLHIMFLRQAKTKEDYLQLWQRKNMKRVRQVLLQEMPGSKKSLLSQYLQTWKVSRSFFNNHQEKMRKITGKFQYKVYYQSNEIYNQVRSLALQKKIIAVQADLRGKKTMGSIAAIASRLKKKVSVVYFSNAEDYPGLYVYPAQFKSNIRALPASVGAVAIRTTSIHEKKRPWAPGSALLTPRGFHYVIQPLANLQAWLKLKKITSGKMYTKAGITDKKAGVTEVTGQPGAHIENH